VSVGSMSASERRTYEDGHTDYHLLLFFLADDLLAFFLVERFDFLAADFFLAGMFGIAPQKRAPRKAFKRMRPRVLE
jgi:hypothetical protein